MRLTAINALDRDAFVALLGGIFERSPWVAAASWQARPFASVDALHAAMVAAVDRQGEARQLELLRAHPELAGKAAIRGELTDDSAQEQAGAGLDRCSPEEFARLQALNAAYNTKFGFPVAMASMISMCSSIEHVLSAPRPRYANTTSGVRAISWSRNSASTPLPAIAASWRWNLSDSLSPLRTSPQR